MEDGKREEAGAGAGAGPSCGSSSNTVVNGKDDKKQLLGYHHHLIQGEGFVDEAAAEDHSNEDEEVEVEVEVEGLISKFVPGPLLPLKQELDKDKDDDSLRRWKEKLLGCVESDLDGQMDPEVKFHSVGIISDDIGEITTPLPVAESHSERLLFTLREGAQYQLKLTFTVLHNIVSGLTYTNTVWKGGIQVDRSKGMLGTFAPQKQPYVETLEEETTPSGVLARGIYKAKLQFEDDDGRCHLELDYSFEIQKRH